MKRFAMLLGVLALWRGGPAQAQDVAADQACEDGHELTPGLCAAGALTIDAFGNLRGGVDQAISATSQLKLEMEADLGRLFGAEGWRIGASAFGIYGKEPGTALTGSLAPPSTVEAVSTFRLNELWLQRDLGEWGSLRAGQLAADAEFTVADAAANLVNSTFGWPVALAEALPSGGPAYPFAAPGARLALGKPEEESGLRLALFSGDPGGKYGEDTDPQRHNRYGTNFSTAGGALVMLEAVAGAPKPEKGPRPWVAKLGGWYHSGGFDSQRRDAQGLSLASPESSGEPRRHGHNQGVYAMGEATVWRGGRKREGESLSLFGRAFYQPADRNAVALQVDAGLAWAGGPFGRKDDTLSLGASYAWIGRDARMLDKDIQAFSDPFRPARTYETVLEVNYDIPVALGLIGPVHVRPLAQWYIHPGAGEPNEDSGRKLCDALLLGARIQAAF